MSVGSGREVDRIRGVYERYGRDERALARWAPENPGNRAMMAERRDATRALLEREGFFPLSHRRILDMGCGLGAEIAPLLEWGAEPGNVVGIDLVPERIALASEALPGVALLVENAQHTSFPDASFDLVLLLTVLSSILDERMSRDVAKEAARVLKTGGAVLWYDFFLPNPYNKATRPVGAGALRRYFPGFRHVLGTLTLLPPLARRLGPLTSVLYPVLGKVPALRSHHFGLLVKPRTG